MPQEDYYDGDNPQGVESLYYILRRWRWVRMAKDDAFTSQALHRTPKSPSSGRKRSFALAHERQLRSPSRGATHSA